MYIHLDMDSLAKSDLSNPKGVSDKELPRLSDRSCEAVWSTGVEFTPWEKKKKNG